MVEDYTQPERAMMNLAIEIARLADETKNKYIDNGGSGKEAVIDSSLVVASFKEAISFIEARKEEGEW